MIRGTMILGALSACAGGNDEGGSFSAMARVSGHSTIELQCAEGELEEDDQDAHPFFAATIPDSGFLHVVCESEESEGIVGAVFFLDDPSGESWEGSIAVEDTDALHGAIAACDGESDCYTAIDGDYQAAEAATLSHNLDNYFEDRHRVPIDQMLAAGADASCAVALSSEGDVGSISCSSMGRVHLGATVEEHEAFPADTVDLVFEWALQPPE